MLRTLNCPVIALEEHYWDKELAALFVGVEGVRDPEILKRLYDLGELRLREMDEAGIDVQILSHGAPSAQRLGGADAVELTRRVNDRPHAVVTATQGIRLGLGGVCDAYPRLKIILGHLGETLPFLVWRVDHALARPGAKTLSFREAFCGHFYITTSGNFSNPALLCCVMEMGIDRILFAVDWPFVANKPAVQWMETVPLRDEDKAKILSGNAKRLFWM